MAQRSLHAVTKVYDMSISCFATDSPAKFPACNAKDSPAKGPSCTMWFRQITKYVTKNYVNSHSTEQDTLPIAFLFSKQVVSYRTCGDTCYLGGSTLAWTVSPCILVCISCSIKCVSTLLLPKATY
jgi:hypothetical protein